MNYRRLGRSGLQVTELTYGTALTVGTEILSSGPTFELILAAWEGGIRSFDTSSNYGSAEALLGEALRQYPRHEYVLASKGSWPIGPGRYDRGLSRKHLVHALERSLTNLATPYLDIYYAHRFDTEVELEEVVRTFGQFLQSGKILYWGTSEWTQTQLEALHGCCDALGVERPIVEQPIFSYAIHKIRENGVKSFCEQNGVGVMGFSPLAQGLLTGKYRREVPPQSRIAKSQQINYSKTTAIYEQNRERIDGFLSVVEAQGVDPVAVALQWCVRQSVLPVVGASRPEQVLDNIRALETEIPESVFQALEKLP